MNNEKQSKINIDNTFLNIIDNAIQDLVSDIHIEPYKEFYKIRFRLNGKLINYSELSKSKVQSIISQLKILANLDITESRFPQDGKIDYYYHNEQLNLRISTCPTILGEKVVIRILQNIKKLYRLCEIGLNKVEISLIKDALAKTSGLVLFTGATGAGKTTSLYACINELDFQTNNIISIEDPVEITFPEINQINVHSKINLTFTKLLKSILRQDPDIIVIGEIRDHETAKIAISAAQTGHLVLATMHSNSASNSINRLLEIGVPENEVLSAIELIIFQKFTSQKNDRKPKYELKKICI